MKLHHLNCATLCPLSHPKVAKLIPWVQEKFCLVCHCILIEHDNGELILIDTGLGLKDVRREREFKDSLIFEQFTKPLLKEEETAIYQIVKLGLDPNNVKHIIATHLDVDHIGGAEDFPFATVHVSQREYDEAMNPDSLKSKMRFHPSYFDKIYRWKKYDFKSQEEFFGFQKISKLEGLPENLFLVPLPGHTYGHMGVGINLEEEGILFFVGDSYMQHSQIEGKTPAWVKIYNHSFQMDLPLFEENLQKLQQLHKENHKQIKIFCAHDHGELHSFLN